MARGSSLAEDALEKAERSEKRRTRPFGRCIVKRTRLRYKGYKVTSLYRPPVYLLSNVYLGTMRYLGKWSVQSQEHPRMQWKRMEGFMTNNRNAKEGRGNLGETLQGFVREGQRKGKMR